MKREDTEALREKFFNECTPTHNHNEEVNMMCNDMWQWIVDNCLQKDEEKIKDLQKELDLYKKLHHKTHHGDGRD